MVLDALCNPRRVWSHQESAAVSHSVTGILVPFCGERLQQRTRLTAVMPGQKQLLWQSDIHNVPVTHFGYKVYVLSLFSFGFLKLVVVSVHGVKEAIEK